jgi:hypothetical protein
MFAKLLTLLAATKGATVAAVVVLAAATVTVGATTPEVQDAVKQVVETVTGQTSTSTTARTFSSDCDRGQPAVVAQRNAATKLIDAAFQVDQKALESLRGKGVDNKAAGDLIKTADESLKDIRTTALNDVAKLTLGREGQDRPSGSPSAKPSKSPEASSSPCPSEAPEASESPKPSGSPKAEGSAKPSEQGRVTVADRTTLDANVKAIVDKAIADMAKVVTDATAKVGALPSPDHGKPSDKPGSDNKPSDNPGKPSGNPGDDHKPSASPKR